MQQPAKLNYKVYQGSTFQEIYRWESQTKVYAPIQSISKAAPCVITTTTNSNIPQGWRFRVTGVQGMKEINTTGDAFYVATEISGSQVTVNEINSAAYTAYTSGGILEYNQPVDLAIYSARMQIRENIDSTTVIHEATSTNNQIVLNNTNKTITITIPAGVTQNFTFQSAVYSVELFETGGRVIPFLVGNLLLVREVTR
jgi:hypothetical protein